MARILEAAATEIRSLFSSSYSLAQRQGGGGEGRERRKGWWGGEGRISGKGEWSWEIKRRGRNLNTKLLHLKC